MRERGDYIKSAVGMLARLEKEPLVFVDTEVVHEYLLGHMWMGHMIQISATPIPGVFVARNSKPGTFMLGTYNPDINLEKEA